MKKLVGLFLAALVGAVILGPSPVSASTVDELKYLGYSDEMAQTAFDEYQKTHVLPPEDTSPYGSKREPPFLDDVEAVQEQLTELGRSRSLTPQNPDKALEVKGKLDEYWDKMNVPKSDTPPVVVTPEIKAQLQDRITQSLTEAGYSIIQLELIDMPSNLGTGQVRAVVRVVKPLKTKHGYREIQNNLGEIKQKCLEAGTIEGILYLSELTYFIAENPRNNYHYEKTVLNP